MGDNRNIILAIVISAAILIPYQIFILGPMNERRQAERIAGQSEAIQSEMTELAANSNAAAADIPSPAEEQRIGIVSEAITGSLSLTGTRIDELHLERYDTEVDDETYQSFLPILRNPQTVEVWYSDREEPQRITFYQTPRFWLFKNWQDKWIAISVEQGYLLPENE